MSAVPDSVSTLRVGLAQLVPHPGSLQSNLERVRETVAAHPGDDLMVFPELFLSGIRRDGYDNVALDRDGPEVAALCAIAAAHRTAIVVGTAMRIGRDVHNAALAITATGNVAGIRSKTHQWGDEGRALVAGDGLEPLVLDGLCVGAMVCFDVEFPEVARTLAISGASVLVTIAANMDPFALDHATFVTARAMENNLPHVYVNRVGEQHGEEFVGESRVVAADGSVLAVAGSDESVLHVDLPLDVRRDDRLSYLRLRRPELYR